MGYFTYWTHGVATVAENVNAPGFTEKRYGWGYEVQQQTGSKNWFHIPLIAKAGYAHADVYLHADVSNEATIDIIHVREGAEPPVLNKAVNITGQKGKFWWNVEDWTIDAGLVLCVHVNFDGGGKVTFHGAGLRHMT